MSTQIESSPLWSVVKSVERRSLVNINSSYPACMLKTVDNPIFTTNTDLSEYFGWVYALAPLHHRLMH